MIPITSISINHRHYGELTVNLVSSLRATLGNRWPIYILSDGSFEKAAGAWDHGCTIIQTLPGNPFWLKCNLWPMFEQPFVYIDADTVVNDPDIFRKWIDTQDGRLFIQQMPEGRERFMWASKDSIAEHHGIAPSDVLHLNSSVITGGTAFFWEKAAEAYDNPMQSHLIGGYYPDEIPLAVAIAKTCEVPHRREVVALPWRTEKLQQYPVITLPGGNVPTKMVHRYTALTRNYALQTGAPFYQFQQKAKVAYG